jgi:hypothetical protein
MSSFNEHEDPRFGKECDIPMGSENYEAKRR